MFFLLFSHYFISLLFILIRIPKNLARYLILILIVLISFLLFELIIAWLQRCIALHNCLSVCLKYLSLTNIVHSELTCCHIKCKRHCNSLVLFVPMLCAVIFIYSILTFYKPHTMVGFIFLIVISRQISHTVIKKR